MEGIEFFVQFMALFKGLFLIVLMVLLLYAILLGIKTLKKHNNSKEVQNNKNEIGKSLSEILKEYRQRCHMPQEFVAESLGVSRQAVSKWENRASEPSTSNLIALAELYGVTAEDLLKNISVK
ncbi:helix-turn-helix transcriptional regulator [Erysipelotrichaceae bacterium HCN-30851]